MSNSFFILFCFASLFHSFLRFFSSKCLFSFNVCVLFLRAYLISSIFYLFHYIYACVIAFCAFVIFYIYHNPPLCFVFLFIFSFTFLSSAYNFPYKTSPLLHSLLKEKGSYVEHCIKGGNGKEDKKREKRKRKEKEKKS